MVVFKKKWLVQIGKYSSAISCIALVVFISSCCYVGNVQAGQLVHKPFTVMDSIKWNRIVSLQQGDPVNPGETAVLFSPSKTRFVAQLLCGSIAENNNIAKILIYEVGYPKNHTKYANRRHQYRLVRRFEIKLEGNDELSELKWQGEGSVLFLAKGQGGISQIHSANVDSGVVSPVTASATDIVAFGFAETSVFYYAHLPLVRTPDWMPINNSRLIDIIVPDGPADTPLQLFQLKEHASLPKALGFPVRLRKDRLQIWPSPSGRWVITFAPATDAPDSWSAYRFQHQSLFGYGKAGRRSDPTSRDLLLRTRYQLVDARTGRSSPLLDAPSAELVGNGTPTTVFWRNDETSVVVSNTFLPLKDDPSRALRPVVAEVELHTGKVTKIVDERGAGSVNGIDGNIPLIKALVWDASSELLTIDQESDGGINHNYFHPSPDGWSVASAPTKKASQQPNILALSDLNERPRIYEVLMGGARREILDPNPWADEIAFGKVSILEWIDRNGRSWEGALVLPPDYDPVKTYPLVIQTHGFNEREFLLDGPHGSTTAMAAQALAGAGIVVLQVQDKREIVRAEENEGPFFAEGVRAAISELVNRKIVDKRKVGLTGFSRTAYQSIHVLGRYPDLIAAAIIADGIQLGYMEIMLATNEGSDVLSQMQSLSGGAPDPSQISDWFSRNAIYALPRTSAAVRIESITSPSVLGMWETFSLLKRAGRPVDFIYYPRGKHVLQRPLERLSSQGGAVDWYRFWLQGYEDTDPLKRSQYIRWRDLRETSQAGSTASNTE